LHPQAHLGPPGGDGLDGRVVGQRDLGRAGPPARLLGRPVDEVEAEPVRVFIFYVG
jgi:hypothetical protein